MAANLLLLQESSILRQSHQRSFPAAGSQQLVAKLALVNRVAIRLTPGFDCRTDLLL